jgi:prepilin-type N-terminal cleavage/methylation domain-containing protein
VPDRLHMPRSRDRRGVSLLEMMVVIAIVLAVTAVMVPVGRSLFDMNQRSAARKLALTIERLHDEAVMRNRTFRISFFLDENRYVIEAGEPEALIAAGPEEREQQEASLKAKLALMTEEERREWRHTVEQPFEALEVAGKMEIQMPNGVQLGGFYAPQYGEIIRPGQKLPGMEKEDKLQVDMFVMSNGYTEHTVIWLVDAKDPTDGWTVEVEPLSGIVNLRGELIDPRDKFGFVPETPPTLPN